MSDALRRMGGEGRATHETHAATPADPVDAPRGELFASNIAARSSRARGPAAPRSRLPFATSRVLDAIAGDVRRAASGEEAEDVAQTQDEVDEREPFLVPRPAALPVGRFIDRQSGHGADETQVGAGSGSEDGDGAGGNAYVVDAEEPRDSRGTVAGANAGGDVLRDDHAIVKAAAAAPITGAKAPVAVRRVGPDDPPPVSRTIGWAVVVAVFLAFAILLWFFVPAKEAAGDQAHDGNTACSSRESCVK